MEGFIKYPYSKLTVIATPVTNPIQSKTFIRLLNEANKHVYSEGSDYKKTKFSIGVLQRYLEEYDISSLIPDERFLLLLKQRLKTGEFSSGKDKLYKENLRRQVISDIRTLINRYLFPKGIAKRQLLCEIVFLKYARVLDLTENSQKAVIWYEAEGKHIQSQKVVVQNKEDFLMKEIFTTKKKDLTPRVKRERIKRSLALLEYVQKKGFEDVTKDDLQRFKKKEGSPETTAKDLQEILNVFVNLQEAGFIENNPFAYFKVKSVVSRAKKDFITKEGIEKLMDLSTLEFENNLEVRDRLICLFLYDTAVRAGEAMLLLCSDIQKEDDGMVKVTMRSEIQKGTDKDRATMYLYFDQTKELLEHYLTETREKFNPKCDSLFLSNSGYSLSEGRFWKIVKDYCEELEVKTHQGYFPSPHVFRHTFATINITPVPFGLNLPLDAIVERLRHVGYETARKHYIHNNPYIKKIKHIEYQKGNEKGGALDNIPFDEIRGWLVRIGVSREIVENIAAKHSQYFSVDQGKEDTIKHIPEKEATELVAPLNIEKRSLRKYCLKNKVCKNSGDGGYLYQEDFITDLAKNWFTKEEVMKRRRRSRTRLYVDIERHKWQTLAIGNVLLIRKTDLIE